MLLLWWRMRRRWWVLSGTLVATEQEWTDHRPCCLQWLLKEQQIYFCDWAASKRPSPSQYYFHYHQAPAGEFQPLFRSMIRLCCDRSKFCCYYPRHQVAAKERSCMTTQADYTPAVSILRTCRPMVANTDEYSTILIFISFNFLIITFNSPSYNLRLGISSGLSQT